MGSTHEDTEGSNTSKAADHRNDNHRPVHPPPSLTTLLVEPLYAKFPIMHTDYIKLVTLNYFTYEKSLMAKPEPSVTLRNLLVEIC